MTPRTLLIDGDATAFLAAYVNDGSCEERAERAVRKFQEDLHAERAIVCLSDPTRKYWKHEIFPAYKNKRGEPPEGIADAKACLRELFISRQIAGLEADDVMGILATHPRMGGERVMVSVDKDLLTVPGLHFNPRRSADGVFAVSQRHADLNHLTHAIVGDSGKGLAGCPRVGEQSVGKVLWGEPGSWWAKLVCAFKGKGLAEADALLQARLARVLRAEDYDFELGMPVPWTPDRIGVARRVPEVPV